MLILASNKIKLKKIINHTFFVYVYTWLMDLQIYGTIFYTNLKIQIFFKAKYICTCKTGNCYEPNNLNLQIMLIQFMVIVLNLLLPT